MPERLPFFATAARGTEGLVAGELAWAGAKRIRQDRGGVRFLAGLDEAARFCVWSRVAMRVLLPVAEARAPGAEGLYEAARAVPWEEHLTLQTTFSVEATVKDTEHTHSGFVALKLKDGLVDRLREKLGGRPDVDTRRPDVHVVAHLKGEQLSLSLDVCGEPLFKRGYRRAQTAAPLKENLAAAVLLLAGYDGSEPLVDVLAGSGTLVVEAGLMATRSAPGLSRSFAAESWPTLGKSFTERVAEVKAEARAQRRPPPAPLLARDYDEEAVAAARRNLKAAGLAQVPVELMDATRGGPPQGAPGLVVSNPPYGERLGTGGQKGMKTFFHALGQALGRWEGWRLALLAGNPAFESAFGKRPTGRVKLFNGPIECTLLRYGDRLAITPRVGPAPEPEDE